MIVKIGDPARINTMYMHYVTPKPIQRFSLDFRPETFPHASFYSMLHFTGPGYTGLQNKQSSEVIKINTGDDSPFDLDDKVFIASQWHDDKDDVSTYSKLLHTAAGNFNCQGFYREGQGLKCLRPYKWELNETYRIMVDFELTPAHTTIVSTYIGLAADGDDGVVRQTVMEYHKPIDDLKRMLSFV